MKQKIFISILLFLFITACSVQSLDLRENVADTPGRAQSADGLFISWKEHLIDDEMTNNGLAIRGGDGLKMADLDRDGYLDIVSVYEDSDHVRIAFGSDDPDRWSLITLAEGDIVDAVEDVAIGDLNGDGWPDLIFACERGHLIYFQNPGTSVRTRQWPRMIPHITKKRGSWLRVFMADINNDGRLDILAANKGVVDIVDPAGGEPDEGTTSAFVITGDPLNSANWTEQILLQNAVPNTAMPVDIDRDGDIDLLAASRRAYRIFILENSAARNAWNIHMLPREISITAGWNVSGDWSARTNAFHSIFKDMNNDGRDDLILSVIEKTGEVESLSFGWLEQPDDLSEPWIYYRIGDIQPDWIAGFALADIDNDGDADVITGGYSGINIIDGGYSGAARDHDDPSVTAVASVGRIAWFANPGDARGIWQRHDISRRVRGMFDEFIPRDMDGDGDIDFLATRGNSGSYDGLFWLEQIRMKRPVAVFEAARSQESRQLPLPPEDWLKKYPRNITYTAPD